jgi:hypothetical protein
MGGRVTPQSAKSAALARPASTRTARAGDAAINASFVAAATMGAAVSTPALASAPASFSEAGSGSSGCAADVGAGGGTADADAATEDAAAVGRAVPGVYGSENERLITNDAGCTTL